MCNVTSRCRGFTRGKTVEVRLAELRGFVGFCKQRFFSPSSALLARSVATWPVASPEHETTFLLWYTTSTGTRTALGSRWPLVSSSY